MECEAIVSGVGDDHVATIILNLPEALNAFHDRMAEEIPGRGRPPATSTTSMRSCSRPNGEWAFCTGNGHQGRWCPLT
jgi:hypothetical protein